MALQGTEDAYEDTRLADNEEEEFSESFVCCVCLDLLYKPIVLSCGHVACFWCVHQSMNTVCESHCPICRHPYYHFPTICQMFHFLLLKMYPVAYKRRENQTLEEEKKQGCFSPQFDDDTHVSEAKFDQPGTSSSCDTGNLVSNSLNAESSASMEQSGSGTHKQHIFDAIPVEGRNLPQSGHRRQQRISIADVMCTACKQLLFHPVVLNCGHVYCESCIKNLADEMLRCQTCQSPHPRGFPKVCLELDHFLEEQFTKEYAKKRDSFQPRHIKDKPETPSCSLDKGGGEKIAWWSDPHSKVHIGVGCDFCGMFPIVGDRYRCKDCKEKVGFDLCGDCYNRRATLPGRFNQQHTSEHEFELIQMNMIHNIMRLVTGQLGEGSIDTVPLENLEFRPEGAILLDGDDDDDDDGDGDGEGTQNDSEGTN